jgi:hypothetical protein
MPLPRPDAASQRLCYPARWPGAVVPALVPAACLSLVLLEGFADAMREAGLRVQVHRMRYDRRYAFERLAAAHGSADGRLRGLALRLFEMY